VPEAGQIGCRLDQRLPIDGAEVEGLLVEEALRLRFQLVLLLESSLPRPLQLARHHAALGVDGLVLSLRMRRRRAPILPIAGAR
jgi:hypothetical protein